MPIRSVHDQTQTIQSEFKPEAVALTQQPGVSCRQIAMEIGINPNLLSRWKREAEAVKDKAFQGSGSARVKEVAQLKRELVRCVDTCIDSGMHRNDYYQCCCHYYHFHDNAPCGNPPDVTDQAAI